MKRVNRGLLVVASGTCTEDVPHSSPLQRLQVEGYRQLSLVSINSMDGWIRSIKSNATVLEDSTPYMYPAVVPGLALQNTKHARARHARSDFYNYLRHQCKGLDFEAFHRF